MRKRGARIRVFSDMNDERMKVEDKRSHYNPVDCSPVSLSCFLCAGIRRLSCCVTDDAEPPLYKGPERFQTALEGDWLSCVGLVEPVNNAWLIHIFRISSQQLGKGTKSNILMAQQLRRKEFRGWTPKLSNPSRRKHSWSKPVLLVRQPHWHLCTEKILERTRPICRRDPVVLSPWHRLLGRGPLREGMLRPS